MVLQLGSLLLFVCFHAAQQGLSLSVVKLLVERSAFGLSKEEKRQDRVQAAGLSWRLQNRSRGNEGEKAECSVSMVIRCACPVPQAKPSSLPILQFF